MNEQPSHREISDATVMAMQPLVSVHMLAYRHERFLAQAIEGVIAQICEFPIELIIAEDCSPDGTLAIALDYQRCYPDRIRVITGNKNVGMHANAARSLRAARGKYVAFCEGDDYWHHPRKLQMQVELMSKSPEMTVCHTDFDRLTRFRRRRNNHRAHPNPWLARGEAYVPLLHDWSVRTATSMYRADILHKFAGTKYDNTSWPFGDINRLLFASLLGTFGYIDESTATFRKMRGSACNRDNLSHLEMMLSVEECFDLFMSMHPVSQAMDRDVHARIKTLIYLAAFFAERKEEMCSEHAWLKDNGLRPSEYAHFFRLSAINAKIPFRLLRMFKNFIDLYVSSIPP